MIRDRQSGLNLSLVWIASAVACAALSGACDMRDPRTQVMLVVDADEDVRAVADSLVVEIVASTEGGGVEQAGPPKTFFPNEPDNATWPYSFAIVPKGGDAKRKYKVVATLNDSKTQRLAVLRAESGFVSQKTVELRLTFEASCLRTKSLDCQESDTCEKGSCVSALLDATTLRRYGDTVPDVLLPDGGGSGTGTTSNPNLGSGGASGASGARAAGSGGRTAVGGGGSGGTAGAAGAPMGDPSMPANCGDGKLTGDEKCDTAIAAGQPGACPTECTPASACEPTTLEGSGCQTACVPHTITAFDSGDGCCPAGADGNSDTDCRSQCGNGQVESGETCDPIETCPTTITCVSANACLKAVVNGDPTACNSMCSMQAIIECVSGDGCCPTDCTRATDMDCSASCGDGQVQAGEFCEPTGNPVCPTSATCNDNDVCTVELFTGNPNNCNSLCTPIPILAPSNGDGCCPTAVGGNANNDNDCQPKCNNGVVEKGERCDGKCPAGPNDCNDNNACTRDGVTGSDCQRACTHTPITAAAPGDGCCPGNMRSNTDPDCPPPDPVCGDNKKEGSEACDDGNTTAGDGCSATCRIEEPVCGNGKKETGEDCDGNCPACTDTNPCTKEQVTSNPDACHPKCEHLPIGSVGGDGVCCPANSTSDVDSDCPPAPPACGNRKLDGDETCDPPMFPCEACVPTNKCSRAVPGGTTCKPTCTQQPIIAPANGDECCPPGANALNDTDCNPVCGNRVTEPPEQCDGTAPAPDTCTDCRIVMAPPPPPVDAGL